MKKLFWTFFVFLCLALGVEVVILISTKVVGWDNFVNGRPFLAAVHVHLMVLGAFFFLIQMLLEKNFSLTNAKFYKVFYIIFIIGMTFNTTLMLYKGFTQIFGGTLISAVTQAFAALAHISLFTAFGFFAHSLYSTTVKGKGQNTSNGEKA